MTGHFDVAPAAALLRRGGGIAYPTEAVWGLGCDPRNEAAVLRLLQIKQRDIGKGLILIAAQVEDLKPYVDFGALPEDALAGVLASWPGPHTWIVPADAGTPRWLTGDHDGIAVRVSAHPTVVALCRAFGGALVSTSANPAGAPPPVAMTDFDPGLLQAIDGVIEGDTGSLERPTPIRDARTGQVLRS